LVDALVSNTCGKPCRFDSGAGYKALIEISGLCYLIALHSYAYPSLVSCIFGLIFEYTPVMKKTLAISNTIALIVTIAINYLSNTGLINGNTMKTISDRYQNYFTPAGYAFSIWGVIYLGLLGFIIYSWRSLSNNNKNQFLPKIAWWFIISCIANSMWVVAWLYDQLGLSLLLMTLLFMSLLKIIQNAGIGSRQPHDIKTLLLVHWPFSIYFGWVTVASIANVAAFLTKIGWSGWGISGVTWAVIMLCIAGLINVLVMHTKKLHAYGLVGIWAVLAISVANQNAGSAIVYTCYCVSGIILVAIAINLLRTRSIAG
jgi:hypothetical protein